MYLEATRDCFVLHDYMFGFLHNYPIQWDNNIERLLPEVNKCKLVFAKFCSTILLFVGIGTLRFILFWEQFDFDLHHKTGASFLTVTAMLGMCSIPAGIEGLVLHWSRQDLADGYNRLYKLTRRIQFNSCEYKSKDMYCPF